MTRLRFTYCEGCYVTSKLVAGKNMVEVMVMPITNSNKALFYKDGSLDAFKVLTKDSLTGLKKLVKKELKSLGVKFNDEIRPRLKRR